MKNYLLLISCSQRKIITEAPLPAIERYDGPVYRCLRKYRDTFDGFPDNLDILIISALYRLIESRTLICNYDERMTDQRAAKLLPQVQELLQWYTNYHKYDQVFINLGKTYMRTLEGFHWGTTPTMEASGGIGLKTQQMSHRLILLRLKPYTESQVSSSICPMSLQLIVSRVKTHCLSTPVSR